MADMRNVYLATRLSKHQMAMLVEAAIVADGTVLAYGFSHGRHAASTGRSLVARGLLVKWQDRASYTIFKITADGRKAVEDAAR
jgi:hypothetical protein